MKVLVFGATGGTGRQVVEQARAAGHEVTAFTRDANGDVTEDADAVARAVRGQDAAISALGRGLSFRSQNLMSSAMRVIVPVLEREGVRRFIVTSAFGVGETLRDAPLLPKIFGRTLLRGLFRDKAAADEYVRRSSLDWTLVYPVMLTNGPRSDRYRAGERLPLTSAAKISRADVAEFIVRQLTDRTWLRKTVIISD
ncbi:MAG: NAD(P)-binding oxidoreductase [Acidobacteriota bacterium]